MHKGAPYWYLVTLMASQCDPNENPAEKFFFPAYAKKVVHLYDSQIYVCTYVFTILLSLCYESNV